MTSFVRPVPLGERWLPARPFSRDLLEDRLGWWREREESWRRFAPFDLEEPGPRPTREARGLCELWFPIERIAREAHATLRAHFELSPIDPSWESNLLARARSWLDARLALASLPALPSALLASLADADRAEAFVFELHDPRSHGHAPDRYPEALERVAALAPRRVWDAGCGTGEVTCSLARFSGEVIGTTPSPWELLMARRRGRPHDRARTLAHRARTSGTRNVSFELGDLLGAPRGAFDLVFVGGVLGGVVGAEDEIASALHAIASALAPGGRVLVVDRFREDRHERARRLVLDHAPRAGLEVASRRDLLELSL